MKPGIQVPIAVAGAWVTLMALIASRRQRAQKRSSNGGESTRRTPGDAPEAGTETF